MEIIKVKCYACGGTGLREKQAFTKEEQKYIKKNAGKLSGHAMAKAIGCTHQMVNEYIKRGMK